MNNLFLEREGGIEPPLPTTAEAAPVARVYDYTCKFRFESHYLTHTHTNNSSFRSLHIRLYGSVFTRVNHAAPGCATLCGLPFATGLSRIAARPALY